jgi:hypothetical protein
VFRHWKMVALVALSGLAALGAGAAAGIGAGASPRAETIAIDYERTQRISGRELERTGPGGLPIAGRAAGIATKPLKLKYYVGTDFQAVAPDAAQLFEVRCPLPGQEALTGGVFALAGGPVISNSSRSSPDPTFPTSSRAWYEGVTNLTGAELQWKPFVTCLQR